MYVEEYDEQEICPDSVTREMHAKIRSGFRMPRCAARLNRKCVQHAKFARERWETARGN